ncbi:MAG: YhbY family RNA-binding protein [Tissierellia bacterium]|nr:YhbY family RNA-binding protein [Tissierellia bacterium]
MITSKERAFLKGKLALKKADFRIGKEGLKEETIEAMDLYLKKNEILKIQFLNNAELEPMEVFHQLEEALGVEFLMQLGHVLGVYRDSERHLYLK